MFIVYSFQKSTNSIGRNIISAVKGLQNSVEGIEE